MKIKVLEIHNYAPELSRLTLRNGVKIPAPGCVTIKAARKKIAPKPISSGLFFRVDSFYDEDKYKGLNRIGVAGGKVSTRLEALRYAKKHHQQSGGLLYNGETLPPNKLKISFFYR